MKFHLKKLALLALPAKASAQIVLPVDFIGGFRIRLYWQNGYNWQESRAEKFWCMECDGSCEDGDIIQIDNCNSSNEQRFIFGGKTIHPSIDPSLCFTYDGDGSDNPIKLRPCNNSSKQNFRDLRKTGKFELKPESMANHRKGPMCVSQKHHPKAKEIVYPEICEKTRATDTTFWVTF